MPEVPLEMQDRSEWPGPRLVDDRHREERQKIMTHDFREIRDRIEKEFADMLGPDLKANAARAVYVVLMSETAILSADADFSGLHEPAMAGWFRDTISPRWKGLGPTFLLHDLHIAESGDTAHDLFVGTAIHELAHVINFPGLYSRDSESDAQPLPDGFVNVVVTSPGLDNQSTRHGHGVAWLRLCIHLTHRMQARGWDIALPFVVDREHYGYSSTSCYRRALGDEPARLAEVPLTTITSIDPPKLFSDLWIADVTNWPDV